MKNIFPSIIIGILLTFSIEGKGQQFFDCWLSGEAPNEVARKVRPSGMQHFNAYRERGQQKFVLWLRSGQDFYNSQYLTLDSTIDYKVYVKGPNQQDLAYSLNNEELQNPLAYDFKEEGFHNIIMVLEEHVGDSTYIHIARQERMSHSCRNGHKRVMSRMDAISYPEIAPLELIRHRQPYENFHGILESGMNISFDILFEGRPVPNHPVVITNQKGWKMEASSDQSGVVTFQLPNDYFSDFKELDKHKTHRFLIETLVVKNDAKWTSYSTKMEFDYIPSKTLYQSKVWAWVLFTFSLLLIGVVLYIRARNHKKKNKYLY
jgi:hypothetical protein